MFITITGRVKAGKNRGKKLGFPTINISVPKKIKKNQLGVYYSLVKIGDRFYPGITHLGQPKTFNILKSSCETHLLTIKKDLYRKNVTKKLIFKFREIEKFPNIKKLKKQILQDIKAAKKFFGL